METTTLKLYSLEYKEAKTYLMAALFIAGNIVFPQLCHTVNMGGPTWLPIYLFTLVGAYKYGWRVGLLTAVASPFINSAWFGMPVPASLPAILLKSILLAGIAGYTAHRTRSITVFRRQKNSRTDERSWQRSTFIQRGNERNETRDRDRTRKKE